MIKSKWVFKGRFGKNVADRELSETDLDNTELNSVLSLYLSFFFFYSYLLALVSLVFSSPLLWL